MKKNQLLLVLLFSVGMFISCAETDDPTVPNNNGPQLSVWLQGPPIHGINGIYFDSDDNILCASVYDRSITKINPQTGDIIAKYGPEIGVDGPDDVIIGPDGSIYWTSILFGEVGKMTPDGTVKKQFVAPGVNPITFSDDGRLFVACDFFGDGLYEVDPNLETAPKQIIPELGWLNGFDFGPDGLLYGPIIALSQIAKIDIDAPSVEFLPVDVYGPCAVKFDSQGKLYVIESGIGQVSRIDLGKNDQGNSCKRFTSGAG